MTDSPGASALTRRTFLGTTGAAGLVAAGALGTPAEAAAPRTAPRTGRVLSLGVLTAGGSSLPRSGEGLVAGLRLGFARAGVGATLAHREVAGGYAGAAAAVDDLLSAGARVIVAGVSAPVADQLSERCREAGAALVVANVGAHVVADPAGPPSVLHSSLQHWQSALSLGQWASRRLGRTLFHIVAAPDAGYDSVFAVRRGFLGAGGELVGWRITHAGPGSEPAAAAAAAKASRASVVAVSATGERAVAIVRALRAHGVTARLLIDPLAVEGDTLRRLGRAAHGAYAASALVPADTDLARVARSATGRAGDPFTVLGQDTASLVAAGARRLDASGRAPADLARVLAGRRVAGARGVQLVHAERGTVSVPLVVRRVAARGSRPVLRVVARRDRIGGAAPAMAVLGGREASAYVNEYLTT